MTSKLYNQGVKKESLEIYKKHFGHLTLLGKENARHPVRSEARPGAFAHSNLLNTHFPTSELPKTAPLEDDYIEQCIAEYTTWVAQTEKRLDLLRYSPIAESFRPTDWSSSLNKEATPHHDD
jgi:hypothetical protein